ncbi:MAG: enoyl-CoA hydratase/isomerase family protein [Candidatus Bathyarchaeota archaeon]|nr:enoyl-CoA hydratase/isomerase family protein [Candidatus Bathyarchaeota archaeon]
MLEVKKDKKIFWVRFTGKINLLNLKTLGDLCKAVKEADMDDDTSAIIICFETIGGADLKELLSMNEVKNGVRWLKAYWDTLRLVRETGKLTIAAVKGNCVAGGNELVMMCDLVVASKSAKFGQPEAIVGSTAMGGGVQLLPVLIGEKRARELLFTGRLLTAEEAYSWGLVNLVVEDGEVEKEAEKLALNIVERVSPQAFRVIKSCLNFWTDLAMLNWPLSRDLTAFVWFSEEFKERGDAWLKKEKLKERKFWGILPKS